VNPIPTLIASAERRWSEILSERPDLEPAVALQRVLLGRVIDAQHRLERGRVPRLSLPKRYLAAKLGRGVPMLRGEPIPLPVTLLAPLMLHLCDDLAAGGAGDPAAHIRSALAEHRLDSGSLLSASIARDQQGIRSTSVHMGLAADLVWLVGELAVGPYVHILQRTLMAPPPEGQDDPVSTALQGWSHGHCPVCGSWPAIAELGNGARTLRCSFCAFGWAPAHYQCTYCGDDTKFRPAAPDPECMTRLLELCTACGGYLKALIIAGPTMYPLVSIEDLATIDLDRAAMERGYNRPPLRT
jgi:FdhE protein